MVLPRTFLLAGIVLLLLLFLVGSGTVPLAQASAPLFAANIEHDQFGYGQYLASNLTNPTIGGVAVNLNWKDVAPTQDSFNWVPLDTEAGAWATQGKQIVLVVRYASSIKNTVGCGAGSIQYLPGWEAARIPTLCNAKGDIIPDYFDATFQADLHAYVSAVMSHVLAASYLSHITYMRIGLGVAGEPYPCVGCSTANRSQLVAWGYSIRAWALWQQARLSEYYPLVNQITPNLIYALGDNDTDPITGQTVAHENAFFNAAHGGGVGQQGLHNVTAYANGAAVQIAMAIRAQYPLAYIQFQPVKQIDGNYISPSTEVQGDITIMQKAGAQSVEWYGPDAADPTLQPLFGAWQDYVNCRFSSIC